MPLFSADDLFKNPPRQRPSLVGSHLLPEQGSLLIIAETESGKSVVGFDIAFSLIMARPLFNAFRQKSGQQGKPYFPVHRCCKILYVDTELGPVGCHERLAQFYPRYAEGQELGDSFQLVTGEFKPLLLTKKDGMENLLNLAREVQPDVLVLDPLAQFHEIDENSSLMNVPLRNLKTLQNAIGCAVILLHHESDKELFIEGKRTVKSDSTARARGHSSITAWADTVLRIHREDKEKAYSFLRISWPKVRHGPKPRPGICFVDFTRMKIQWVCPMTGDYNRSKDQFLRAYKNQYPEEVEEAPELPPLDNL